MAGMTTGGLFKPGPGTLLCPAHPLAAGLVGAWPLLEGGGTPRNLVRPDAGAALSGPTWTQGARGPALRYNAFTDYYNTNQLAGQVYAAGTIVWSLYPGFSPTDSVAHMLWGQMTGVGTTPAFTCLKYSDNTWYVGWNSAGADRRVVVAATTSNLQTSAWQIYAFVWTPSGSVLYRNGALLGSNATAPTLVAVALPFWIGGASTTGNNQAGVGSGSLIDVLYFYNRALSPAEIQWLASAPYAPLGSVRPARSALSLV